MSKFSVANFPNMQTPCTHCAHIEWDHYGHCDDSRTACDSGGCRCHHFGSPEHFGPSPR